MNTLLLIVLLLVISVVLIIIKTRSKAKPQTYTLLPSLSGREWFLGQRMNGQANCPANPDSRPFLESLGFRILGKADEMRYAVEPPEGWSIVAWGPRLHSYITDDNGEPRFWIFEKQEMYEFRAYIYEDEKLNQRVRQKKVVAWL